MGVKMKAGMKKAKRAKSGKVKISKDVKLKVVYTCPKHSDQALQSLIELLAEGLIDETVQDKRN